MPDPCTKIHPQEEFLDCAHGDGGNVAGNGSAEMLGSWVLLVNYKNHTLCSIVLHADQRNTCDCS